MEDWLREESAKVREMIQKYFTYEDWNKIPDILQSRYLVTTRNYLDTPFGESFMPKPEYTRYQKIVPNESSEICINLKIDESVPKSKPTKRKIPVIRDETVAVQVRKNPKRNNISIKNYFEEEQPKDDRYIFCDFCEEEYLDVCSKCGGLVSLEDNPVPRGTEDRAMKTAPKGVLEVRRSEIHGFGVFALKNLRKGLRLGPYDGSITRIDTQNGYAWKMRDGRLIDANDTRNSNYLRYVNCPRKAEEQNLVAFQYKGSLYYRTCRDISKGEELLVFYGVTFARNLGIDPKKYFEPEEEKIMPDFYTCKFCSIGLGTEKFRDTHQKYCRFDPKKMRRYEGEMYQCQFCKCGSTTKEFLERHERKCSKREGNIQIDGKKNHSCLYCEEGFTYKSQLYVHVIEIHEKENTQVNSCWNCDSKNIFIHGSDQISRCQNCGERFHIKKFRKLFSCEHCEYKTVNSSALNKHQLKHKKPATKYAFDLRSYTSSYEIKLKKHLLIHSDDFPYFCIECKKRFHSKQELDGHILKNHIDNGTLMSSISSKIHHCEFCEYKTVYSSHSTIHQLKHNKDNNAPRYHCQECNYSSFQKGVFKSHSRIHSKNFPYLCSGCEKRFNIKISLDSHILNNHRDNETLMSSISNKIHHCEFCEYKTVKSSESTIHQLKHNKDNIAPSYHCKECNYTSFRKGSFERHSRIHSKNFPYFCDGCEKRFNEKTNLDSHILNNHRDNQTLMSSISNRILHCECCNYQTINSFHLKQHTKKHNKNI